MNAGTISMQDLSRQRRLDVDIGDGVIPAHTVGQAIEVYLDRMGIPPNGQKWTAYAGGVRLDSKQSVADLPDARNQWTVLPEVSAGAAR